MNDVVFKIQGVDAAVSRLRAAPELLRETVGKALYQFGEMVMAKSKEVVPVDTGALMATGKVMLPEMNGDIVEVTLGYGDEAVDYALYVHEELQSPSGRPINWTRPGSGPKYLENPLKEVMEQLPGFVADAIREAFRVR